MKKLQYNLAAKITAVFLFILSLVTAFAGVAGIAYMENEGCYDSSVHSFYESGLCSGISSGYANTVYYDYFYLSQKQDLSVEEGFRLKQLQEKFSKENTNFFFTVTDEEGHVLLSNYEKQNYGTLRTYSFESEENNKEMFDVNAYVKDPISAQDDYYTPYQIFQTLYSMRYAIIAIAAGSALLALLLFIFLLCSAGHRKGREDIVLNAADKIPFDLYLAGIFFVSMFTFAISGNYLYPIGAWEVVLFCATAIFAVLLALALCYTFAARFKAGRWWENTVTYWLLKWIRKIIRFAGKALRSLLANLPLLWKTIIGFLCLYLINFVSFVIFMDSGGEAVFFLFGILFNLVILAGLCFVILQLNKLKRGGEKIAGGDYTCKIDTKNMFWEIKAHAEALNNIGIGMSKAVEERLKSERFKTELITNVSHDIKTPLTSIVNYVDLLKKEEIESEKAQEYIAVLDRQSARLKKLTEDLVEASKASTGNISMNPVRTDIVELLNQSVGEYAERFLSCRLETVIHMPQNKAEILADGRLLWRVVDNLLNNICKYSQPDTRVYFDVEDINGRVKITLKNISKYPLNITSDELIERFVRGDSARTTEGSGLGLSIAKGLTELQKGSFVLSVDGDLFKVVLEFDRFDG